MNEPKVRVLVVDDSVTVRKLVTEALSADPEIEIVGTAANGRIALQKISQVCPDVVTLDVEMPELDGLSTLVEIRKTHAKLPVVMFSGLTERAASSTLEALARGATDYVTKPSSAGGVAEAMRTVREELGRRVKALGRRAAPPFLAPVARAAPSVRARPDLLAIGASTGGPNAVADVLSALAPLPIPVVITQHMPPLFTRLFAERLSASTPHKVKEAEDGDPVEPGSVLVAPGDYHMTFTMRGPRVVVKLNQAAPENSCRPAVDPMLRSAVEIYGANVLAVILTGMGQDGLRGCEHVRAVGGQVVVQDEATSVVWGMPGFVARANLAQAVVPLSSIAHQISSRLGGMAAAPERLAHAR